MRFGIICLLLLGVAGAKTPAPGPESTKFRVGRIRAAEVRENSGLVASRRHPGVFWTINDSGNAPVLYAITRDGGLIRAFPVAAANEDWEDLAIDDAGRLYIADTGNNDRKREELRVLCVEEPDPHAPASGEPAKLRVQTTWKLRFPGKPFDCESLFVLDGKGYVLPKRMNGSQAELYAFDLAPAPRAVTLQRVGELPAIRGPVTAADVSPDGKRLAILTLLGPFIIDINGDIANAAKVPARHSRFIATNMEAACFVDGGLLVTTESRDIYLFRDEHFK